MADGGDPVLAAGAEIQKTKVKATLPAVKCPRCGHSIQSIPWSTNRPPRATRYESCLRRCEECGLGFSNANTDDMRLLTRIYREPFGSLPPFISDGYELALANALHVRNRSPKAYKFLSSNSEDHVTWTVFRFLVHEGKIGETMRRLDVVPEVAKEPTLLLWGVPIPQANRDGFLIRERIEVLSDSLNERPDGRSEPDIVLDFKNAGVVLIEVKLRSSNDWLAAESPKWNSYLERSDAFVDPEKAKRSGLYELCRNWRIAFDLAGDRPAKLINLGPESLCEGKQAARMKLFRESLSIRSKSEFLTVSWRRFLAAISDKPEWLTQYILERRIVE